MLLVRIIVVFSISLTVLGANPQPKKTIVRSITVEQMKFLRAVDKKYQKKHGIHLKLKKTVTLGMLGSTKESFGEAWLGKGKMRLEINKPSASKIIADGTFLWIESAPPVGFDGGKTQVLKASLSSERAKSQGLIQLLTGGGVLKYFKVAGIQNNKDSITYYLQPENQAIEFKRAQLVISKKDQTIHELRYWDQVDNETLYSFDKTQFNLTLGKKIFKYSPPKDAEVISY